MPAGPNPYSSALGLADLDLPALVASGELNNRSAIMAALVEHGAPLPLEAIAQRLHPLGMGESEERLLRSLRKAWGASNALHKHKDGTISLDVGAPDAQFLKVQVALATEESQAPAPAPVGRPDTQPLTEEELAECLPGAYVPGLSGAMLAAMVIEATGRPMKAPEINAYLAQFTTEFRPLGDPRRGTANSPLVDLDEEGRLHLNPKARGLRALRTNVRAIGERARQRRDAEARSRAHMAEMERERVVEQAAALTVVPDRQFADTRGVRGSCGSGRDRVRDSALHR